MPKINGQTPTSDHLHVRSVMLVNRKGFIWLIPVIQEFPTNTKLAHTKLDINSIFWYYTGLSFLSPSAVLSKSNPGFPEKEELCGSSP